VEIDKRLGPLDILVSNAGIGIFVPSIVEMYLASDARVS
jgi:NAD(P)-dependent dehydrogenase (short-subunit alcohol dehydrogenase family)